jgi:hypothetical protein
MKRSPGASQTLHNLHLFLRRQKRWLPCLRKENSHFITKSFDHPVRIVCRCLRRVVRLCLRKANPLCEAVECMNYT